MEEDSLSVQFLLQKMHKQPKEERLASKAQQMASKLISMIGNEIENENFEVSEVQVT